MNIDYTEEDKQGLKRAESYSYPASLPLESRLANREDDL